ncbi:MAG: SMP-30/gluconolactonase/LRE family protein [Acidimicrobiia bacterium]
MTLEVYEQEVEKLVGREAELELLADGFQFTEGPVWDFRRQCLFFSDIPADMLYVWRAEEGNPTVHRQPSNFSNGLTIDHQGRLITCEHRTRRVTREAEGEPEVVADGYRGKRLNAPNDVVVARDGSLLFTDPHYGLGEGFGGPAEQEQPVRGVYLIRPGGGDPELLADDFEGPNGLVLSPDEQTLCVVDTERGHIRAFRVEEGWSVSGGEVLVELSGDGEGVPDGLKVDRQGTIYCTGPGGVWVCSPEGDLLGRIRTPEVAANLAWGEDDARTLFITASTGLYRLRCRATGYVPYR